MLFGNNEEVVVVVVVVVVASLQSPPAIRTKQPSTTSEPDTFITARKWVYCDSAEVCYMYVGGCSFSAVFAIKGGNREILVALLDNMFSVDIDP